MPSRTCRDQGKLQKLHARISLTVLHRNVLAIDWYVIWMLSTHQCHCSCSIDTAFFVLWGTCLSIRTSNPAAIDHSTSMKFRVCAVDFIWFYCPVVCLRVDVNTLLSLVHYKFRNIKKFVVLSIEHTLLTKIVDITFVHSYERRVRIHRWKSA